MNKQINELEVGGTFIPTNRHIFVDNRDRIAALYVQIRDITTGSNSIGCCTAPGDLQFDSAVEQDLKNKELYEIYAFSFVFSDIFLYKQN